MSDVTGISRAALYFPVTPFGASGSDATPGTASTPTQSSATQSSANNPSARPADVVSLSAAAAAAPAQAHLALPSLDPNAVDSVLAYLSGGSGRTTLQNHGDQALQLAQSGDAATLRNQAVFRGEMRTKQADALTFASKLGIPVQVSDASGRGASGITVGAFNFNSSGANYAVAPGADGTLVGTKDGQAWKTWTFNNTGVDGAAAASGTASSPTVSPGSVNLVA